jgi:ribonuclease HI
MSPAVPDLRIYTDGASRANPGPAACAYIAIRDDDSVLAIASQYLGSQVTNNVAEYRGMQLALSSLSALTSGLETKPAWNIKIYSDSRLVVEQVNGRWKVKEANLKPLCCECQQLLHKLRAAGHQISLEWIPREQNARADQLCNHTLDSAPAIADSKTQSGAESHTKAVFDVC